MRKMSTRVVFIPPKLGYAETGVKGRVPANAFLIYEIQVVDVSRISPLLNSLIIRFE